MTREEADFFNVLTSISKSLKDISFHLKNISFERKRETDQMIRESKMRMRYGSDKRMINESSEHRNRKTIPEDRKDPNKVVKDILKS